MYDITYEMLAEYTVTEDGQKALEEEIKRYKSYGTKPEVIYESICNNDILKAIVSTGLYKIMAVNMTELLYTDVGEMDVVKLLLFPCSTSKDIARYAKVAGVQGSEVMCLSEYVTRIDTADIRIDEKYLNDIHKLLGVNVALTGSDNAVAKSSLMLEQTTDAKLVMATLCELVRSLLFKKKVFYIKLGFWMQFELNSILNGAGANERYCLSTMLLQPKRRTTYGKIELDIVASNVAVSPNYIGREVPSGVVYAHLVCNVRCLAEKLSNVTAMSVSLFETAFRDYRDAKYVTLAGAKLYRVSDVAISTDDLDVLVRYMDNKSVISIYDKRHNTAVTTDADYWGAVSVMQIGSAEEKALSVLRKYISDDVLCRRCLEELSEIGR